MNSFPVLSVYYVFLTVLCALVLDRLLSEPRKFHPLVGFGYYAGRVESRMYGDTRRAGVVALLLVILPFVLLTMALSSLPEAWWLDVVILYLALGGRSLWVHAQNVRTAILDGDLDAARQQVAYLVSRDARTLNEEGIARATVESVLENGNDAVFAAIFWFVVAGAPGVVLYRLVNTLDAMWGYRHAQYVNFGWAAARLDDVLNLIPARLTAFSYALSGHFRQAIFCWRSQGGGWKSPNAGPVMAAGAGSIGVVLGGPETYHGELQARPILGCGRKPDAATIKAAQSLLRRALFVWLIVLLLLIFLCNLMP